MIAKLGKTYSNHTGRRFQRVAIFDNLSEVASFDICIRATRDGLIMFTSAQCKERALGLYRDLQNGLRHSSLVRD